MYECGAKSVIRLVEELPWTSITVVVLGRDSWDHATTKGTCLFSSLHPEFSSSSFDVI